jgi:hypothetical protein
MPEDLVQTLVASAASQADVAVWQGVRGSFAFRMCRPSPDAVAMPASVRTDVPLDCEILRVPVEQVGRTDLASATALRSGTTDGPESGPPYARDAQSDRLTGRLVHRLFQRRVPPGTPESDVAALAERLVEIQERVEEEEGDLTVTAGRAAQAFLTLRRNKELAALLDSGHAEYEVPVSMRAPGGFIQGAVDCVVTAPDGSLTVLEFKTGARRPEHELQATLYANALSAACPGRRIDVKILYPEP